MQKLFLTLSILIVFISCKTQNSKNSSNPILPANTTFVEIEPESFISKLPNRVNETSGIIVWKNLLWTHNDSGGDDVIYGIDFSGEIKKEVEIENAKNLDWEDLAQDEKNIYVGDFGNNMGTRKSLAIYKLKKKDFKNKKEQKVEAKKISFVYKEQDQFVRNQNNHSFDCEALVEFNSCLYLFTKDWANRKTAVYKIPKEKGNYEVSRLDEFDVDALITGADISPDKSTLALVGYKNYKPIIWIFSDINEKSFFGGKKIYAEMPSVFNAQTEGICFLGNDTLLISSESTSRFVQQVFLVDLKKLNTHATH